MNDTFKEFLLYTGVVSLIIFGVIGWISLIVACWAYTGPWLGIPVTVITVAAFIVGLSMAIDEL